MSNSNPAHDDPDDKVAVDGAAASSLEAAISLPEGYGELLEQLKDRVRTNQVRATRGHHTEL